MAQNATAAAWVWSVAQNATDVAIKTNKQTKTQEWCRGRYVVGRRPDKNLISFKPKDFYFLYKIAEDSFPEDGGPSGEWKK